MTVANNGVRGHEGEMAETEGELAFDDTDAGLPWLESDEEDEEIAGFDTTRLLGVGLIMLVALGVIIGGIWWLTNGDAGGGPEPDGSLIAAPSEPFKSVPENPGGKTFPGTGDTSFAVGEGQTREGRLAENDASAQSGSQADPQASSDAEPEGQSAGDNPLPSGTAVQVGAYPSRAAAEAGWTGLTRQTDVLSGVSHRVLEARADIGTVYRLQAVGGDRANAQRLCAALKADGIVCLVK